ncbi:LysR family transcriptional regulator [Thalassobacillus devorans]|uniref:LysR family transcriptional regulator n=1 Tax=Thalassobacillus devorans TaxID=279813 RepID=UPI000A1CDEC7|nr:LysR family transcriptional regulator [Thalassobacillus devorans]
MDLEALRTFIAVVEGKSFTKAAKTRMISQPSVSLHIKNLEELFQTKLIDRSPKHFHVTPTGELVYQRAKQIAGIVEKTKEEVFAYHNQLTGSLTIGASYTVGEYILPALLKEFDQVHPNIELNVYIDNTETINRSVLLHEFDIGLVEGQVKHKELRAFPFLEDEMVLIAPPDHPIREKDTLQFSDLQGLTWVGREEGSGTRDIMDAVIRAYSIDVRKLITIGSNHGVVQAVQHGLGLSFISRSIIDNKFGEDLMIRLPFIQMPNRYFSCVTSDEEELSKNVEVFMKALKEKYSTSI